MHEPHVSRWCGAPLLTNLHRTRRGERCDAGAPARQVSDFLMRVKSRRFPSIEKDMKMVLAHCGSLLLDPASLCQARPPAGIEAWTA